MTCLVIFLGIAGVVIAGTSENKRRLVTTAYFLDTANTTWYSITTNVAVWSAPSGPGNSTLMDYNGNDVPIYLTQNVSNPACFMRP